MFVEKGEKEKKRAGTPCAMESLVQQPPQQMIRSPETSHGPVHQMPEAITTLDVAKTPPASTRTLSETDARKVIEMATLYHERKSGAVDRAIEAAGGLELHVLRTVLHDIGIDEESIDRAVADYAPTESAIREIIERTGDTYSADVGQRKYIKVVLETLNRLYPLEEFTAQRDARHPESSSRPDIYRVRRRMVSKTKKPGMFARMLGWPPKTVVKERVEKTFIGRIYLFYSGTHIEVHDAQFARAIEQTLPDLAHYERGNLPARQIEYLI